jgi:uncharacterized protein
MGRAETADSGWARHKSFYPRLDEVAVYRIAVERITGKKGPPLPSGEQWPARDNSKSPDAVPPRRN